MFLKVLFVCNHGGLVSIGERCFKAKEKYGLSPTLEHYNSVINLFGRYGQLDEAIAMLETMPFNRKKGGRGDTLYISVVQCYYLYASNGYILE